ncbi:gluconate 2-dehydrogenase subunit 3 family protein [Roseivirga seohaensis]|uniref:gluconate 2-dehydrogenase subunit 3 family protein n=1 Tax=Roseivirga seohaensis TaxID=1914963 RepID=UPI003BAA2FB4
MDRRESLKSLLVGSVAGGLLVTGCAPESTVETPEKPQLPGYGRNEAEKEHDAKVLSETFFTEHELETIAVLCDIILPANAEFGSASDAGVPEFIEFIAKDMPNNQLPIRGGLAWLDSHSNKLYGMEFKKLNDEQHKTICDSIAYPGKTAPELKHGERFFTNMRNLTMTGYFTSEMGVKDLGYKGNMPGVWDGIPEDVLEQQGLAYEEEWLAKCVDQSKRMDIATWDDDGNLLT